MTTTTLAPPVRDAEPTVPKRPRRKRRAGTALVTVLALAVLMSGCTMRENSQYRVDIQPWGTLYVHIYQVPSFAMILLRDVQCNGNMDCTTNYLRTTVTVDGPATLVWNYALNNKQELSNAISVSKHSYNPTTGWLQCLMIYSVWTTGWGNSSDPNWCKHG